MSISAKEKNVAFFFFSLPNREKFPSRSTMRSFLGPLPCSIDVVRRQTPVDRYNYRVLRRSNAKNNNEIINATRAAKERRMKLLFLVICQRLWSLRAYHCIKRAPRARRFSPSLSLSFLRAHDSCQHRSVVPRVHIYIHIYSPEFFSLMSIISRFLKGRERRSRDTQYLSIL